MGRLEIAVCAYLGAMILTFGHAAAGYECRESMFVSCEEQTVATAMFSAIFQPFYWSWLAFEGGAK